MDLLDRLGLDHPILQAGMAGGIATPELVAAVSRAGALGTLGLVPPARLRADLRRARELDGGRAPAVGLLLPFTRPEHVEACLAERPRAVVLFFGFAREIVERLRGAGIPVIHQVGTPAEARRALAEGADALVAQGLEAGGHLLARAPRREALDAVLAVAGGAPVIAAGGIATRADVEAALAAGAAAVACGSRFLLTEEAGAHPAYQRRVLGAPRTLVTRLFGLGWRARHRVVPNRATDRWCDADGREPWLLAGVQRLGEAVARRSSGEGDGAASVLGRQRLGVPLFSPVSLRPGMDEALAEVTPLYAGEGVRWMDRVIPAAEAVALLAASAVAVPDGGDDLLLDGRGNVARAGRRSPPSRRREPSPS
jgi:NAD(P)H-dependent flavin oxidoreductase YrpB (nitropropane dioxygenase family)